MAKNLATKILEAHLASGELVPGREIALRIDHTAEDRPARLLRGRHARKRASEREHAGHGTPVPQGEHHRMRRIISCAGHARSVQS